MILHPQQIVVNEAQEPMPVDVHKVPLYVHLHDIAWFRVILGNTLDVVIHPGHSVMCPFSYSATITVFDEKPLVEPIRVIEKQMMHYPVSEMGSKDLSLLGSEYDETHAFRRLILTAPYLVPQFH